MELDEVKQAWQAMDRRLELLYDRDLAHFKERRLAKVRSGLKPLIIGQSVQVLVGAVLAIWFGGFWVEHRATPHLLIAGLSLHLYALMFIVCAAQELLAISRIDFAAPVLAIQRRLAELRATRVRIAAVFAAAGCLIWVPLMLMLFRSWFGFDLFARSPETVYACIGSAVALLGVLGLLIRNPRTRSYLVESSIGQSLIESRKVVDDIRRFERD